MSTTLLPFLYQTRTLQRMSRAGLSTPGFRALLHSTARANHPRDRDRPKPIKPAERGADDIPFELPEGYEPHDTRTDAERDAESGTKSTITPSERETFSRIFEEIAARQKPGAPPTESTAPSSGEGDVATAAQEPKSAPSLPGLPGFKINNFEVRTEEPNPESIRNTINIIVQDAAEVQTNSRRQTKTPFDALHPLEQVSSATEWEKAFLRFPPSLRQAARMALGTVEEGKAAERIGNASAVAEESSMTEEQRAAAQIDLVLDPLSKSVQNEALRREERNRVDAKMRAAKSDFELWDVLEEEVFPLVQKLGLDEDASKTESSSKRGGKRKRDKSEMALHIYGPLYPAYLLNALVLFDTQFARSSPLALHILPRVKELGPASYVLGVSTPFYNELARLLWNRYGDPTAVFNLLEEMRVVGLYCDEGTRQVVLRIEQFLASVGEGRWGPFLRELASLPEYEFAVLPRIRHWMKTINIHIVERRNALQE
ncbi:uncharacterized protein B0H64DRAFT_413576 [Chaetomium fimeti]|uniref:Mtf2-like C-terminal domain-containing protein n=1 Tax=Chaetomium fimeti TaxID=1854472 RepID=A0AAE0LMD1_9PEZI|nr:hypothetical protein B0H64DRAFT_413576 [Chaetomium fimeti]